jgi:hypothetical protein
MIMTPTLPPVPARAEVRLVSQAAFADPAEVAKRLPSDTAVSLCVFVTDSLVLSDHGEPATFGRSFIQTLGNLALCKNTPCTIVSSRTVKEMQSIGVHPNRNVAMIGAYGAEVSQGGNFSYNINPEVVTQLTELHRRLRSQLQASCQVGGPIHSIAPTLTVNDLLKQVRSNNGQLVRLDLFPQAIGAQEGVDASMITEILRRYADSLLSGSFWSLEIKDTPNLCVASKFAVPTSCMGEVCSVTGKRMLVVVGTFPRDGHLLEATLRMHGPGGVLPVIVGSQSHIGDAAHLEDFRDLNELLTIVAADRGGPALAGC